MTDEDNSSSKGQKGEQGDKGDRGFRGHQGKVGEQGPQSDDAEALLAELQRVGSDLGFRLRTRKVQRFIAAIAVGALVASAIAIFSVVAVRYVQIQACERDNDLRAAYVDQWKPVLEDTPVPVKPPDDASQEVKDEYEASVRQRATFEESLYVGFSQHPC